MLKSLSRLSNPSEKSNSANLPTTDNKELRKLPSQEQAEDSQAHYSPNIPG